MIMEYFRLSEWLYSTQIELQVPLPPKASYFSGTFLAINGFLVEFRIKLPTEPADSCWFCKGTSQKNMLYGGVSLNGGTPKTPQNGHF